MDLLTYLLSYLHMNNPQAKLVIMAKKHNIKRIKGVDYATAMAQLKYHFHSRFMPASKRSVQTRSS